MASSRHSLDYAQAVKRSPPPLIGASGIVIKENKVPKNKARRQTLSPASMQRDNKEKEKQFTTSSHHGTAAGVLSQDKNALKGSSRRKTVSPQKPRHATSGLPKPAGRKDKNPANKEATKPRSAKHEGLAHTCEERRQGEKNSSSSNKEKNTAVVHGPEKATATDSPTQKTPNQKTPISLTQESKNHSKLYTPKSPGSLEEGSRGSQRILRKLLFRELIPPKTSKSIGVKDSKNSMITKIFGIP